MTQPTITAKKTTQDLLVGACGLATSVMTAYLLFLVEDATGVALYSFTYAFVLPIGAAGAGLVAAGGYYFGSRFFGHRPSRLLLVNIVLASIATFFLIHYLAYTSLVIEGERVADYLPFGQYLDISIRSTAMTFNVSGADVGDTGELGAFGYVVAALQIIGFAGGGVGVHNVLTSDVYCESCSKYFRKIGSETRYYTSPEAFNSVVSGLVDMLGADDQNLLVQHSLNGSPKNSAETKLLSKVTLRHCPGCNIKRIEIEAQRLAGRSWEVIPEVNYFAMTNTDLSFHSIPTNTKGRTPEGNAAIL